MSKFVGCKLRKVKEGEGVEEREKKGRRKKKQGKRKMRYERNGANEGKKQDGRK